MDEKKSSLPETKETPTLIRGIQGLANFLGVSQPTAQRLKNAKLFPCIQHGRTIFFKPDEVLDGLAQKGKRMQQKKMNKWTTKNRAFALLTRIL